MEPPALPHAVPLGDGEIYNYKQLAETLRGRGHVFKSRSDSETIVHAYEEWGDDCVDRLRGMFAFAIWDRRARRVLLARDHSGIKPLYFTDRAGQSRTPLEITNVPTRAGETHRYVLRTDTPPGVGGAFGHGARLLSYAAPTAARTELAAGETGATIVIVYGPTVARESFRATLGGRDVSARFKPAPGASEAVRLPLAPGSSSLVLSIRGTAPDGQTIVHTDQLELVRR